MFTAFGRFGKDPLRGVGWVCYVWSVREGRETCILCPLSGDLILCIYVVGLDSNDSED